MSDALESVLGAAVGIKALKALPIGRVTLSERLYHGARETAARARQVIEDHVRFEHSARKLALELFEGYGFRKPGDEPLQIKVRMPRYLDDGIAGPEVRRLLARIQASRLKTGALRAGYLQALDAILKGAGQEARDKALRVAIYERHRYFANRIAQTELHRAQTDQIARELMDEPEMEIVEYRLSQSHPKPDICDLYARMDRYGLGPGLYPREHCPKPPLHPFCRCLLRPRLDLHGVKVGRPRKAAAASVLRATGQSEGARIAGSRAKRAAILGGENLEEVLNEGRAEAYRIQTLGGTILSVEKVSAYEVAKARGKHHGLIELYKDKPTAMLQKAARTLRRRIGEHEVKIASPDAFLDADVPSIQRLHLVNVKWPAEIKIFEDEISVLVGMIQEREYAKPR